MTRVALLDPLAELGGSPAMFLRDNFGSEAPFYAFPYPPLDLAFAAAVLRRDGVAVDLVDANVRGWRHDEVARRLAAAPPDLVLVPSAWRSAEDDLRLLRLLRESLPAARLIMSGPNVTAEPERFLRGGADLAVLGEHEEALLLLARGEPAARVPNLAWLENGALARSERRPPPGWPDYPAPARDLLDLSRYWIPFSKRLPSTTMVTARGCSHGCTFCPTQIWHRRQVRYRPVETVLAEMEELADRWGIKEVVIRDDTFTLDRARVLAICEGLSRRRLDLTWRCFATASTVDPRLLRVMAAAGCVQVCYGFESGDDAVLRRTGKGTTVAQGRQAALWTKEAGMEVGGTFLVGFEGDTPETVGRSIAFAVECGLDYVQVNPVLPLPGTGFGRRSPAFSPEEATRQVRRFHRGFYLRPGYWASRLSSGRGLASLWRQAAVGARVAAYALLGGGVRARAEAA